jgi:hypothetical protein
MKARPADTHEAKRLLDQFIGYIEEILGMDTRYDNRVYVVSLGAGNRQGWSLSWIDIVEKRARYFYPVGRDSWSRRSTRDSRSFRFISSPRPGRVPAFRGGAG